MRYSREEKRIKECHMMQLAGFDRAQRQRAAHDRLSGVVVERLTFGEKVTRAVAQANGVREEDLRAAVRWAAKRYG